MKPEQQKGFDRFWKEVWPHCRRIGKKKASQYWEKIPVEKYEAIYAAVERAKKQPSWNTGDCKFIPYPERYLRDERWEDEISLPEDKDVDVLLEALADHASVPPDFPKHIMDRFRKVCERTRTNWPLLHHRLEKDAAAAGEIRKFYLETAE